MTIADDPMETGEDIPLPAVPGERIFFGSLEIQERKRLERVKMAGREEEGGKEGVECDEEEDGEEDGDMEVFGNDDSLKKSMKGDDTAADEPMEMMELSEEGRAAKERQEKLLREFEIKRRARALAVPTNDNAVRQRLRALGEPMTLFGEREMERRDRLRQLMARLDAQGELEKLLRAQEGAEEDKEEVEDEEAPKAELFFTEGSAELRRARGNIAEFSLRRAAARIARSMRRQEDPDEDIDKEIDAVLEEMSYTTNLCSEIGDDRPVSGCAFSPDGSMLATCGWTGVAKLWSVPGIEKKCVFRGHTERVTSVVFHPESGRNLDTKGGNIATASADHTARLWNLEGAEVQCFKGHIDRLAKLAFHPSGLYLGTAGFDKTWRLWDVNRGVELLLQEGHSRSVYSISFQVDGSLVATGGLDALGRVWDLRTGRSILALEGHVKPVLAVEFSPNGYHLATGGEDHTCRIWDIRKKQSLYIIPAHSSLVSQIKYEPREGYFLVTASYDNTARIWSARDFRPIKTLAAHEGKIMGVDVVADGQYISTVSFDRTIKLWAPEKPPEAEREDDDMLFF
ncbi:hypothetical protein CBR_g723 [Chara braunii]|uniref:Pre-mRNA processing factor 4 (PRP4)-like domain-containing protein n=1 Tax=Chara braunii TaxID=69332 RepID=A0A388KC02_CHABU|nr:hypothetical protein CBR_g723 [Chara braunii]|eukprot:GBG67594.1 hypothetical protein CBR_g723 [Chara braunii]